MTTPGNMAKALATSGYPLVMQKLQTAGSLLATLAKFLSVDIQPFGDQGKLNLVRMLETALQAYPPAKALDLVLEAYAQALSKLPPGQHAVLVIDECNTLSEWRAEDGASVRSLLRFFVKVSRQVNKAHVVLATSDSAFIDWIKDGESNL